MITCEQFVLGCQRLAALWNGWFPDGPAWEWTAAAGGFTASLGGGYLAMQMVPRPAVPGLSGSPEPPQSLALGQEVPPNIKGLLQQKPTCQEVHWWTYHVIFSPSFGVPVMYFDAQDSGGSSLTRAQILASLHARTAASASTNAVVTQEEHPVLQRPFFMLHPCQTDEVLSLLSKVQCDAEGHHCPGARPGTPQASLDPQLYMMAWLSVAGSVFGLQLPLEVWKEYWQQSEAAGTSGGTAVT